MFNTFSESSQQTVTIDVAEGSSITATVLVLRYLYTSEISISADNVMEILAAADKLQLSELCHACVDFLRESVNAASVCTILSASMQMNLIPLLKACNKFIMQNGKAVLESEGFKQLTKEAVVSIISNPNLHATEEEVFEAVMLWGKAVTARSSDGDDAVVGDVNGNGNGNTVGAIRDVLFDVLPHLRLDEMDHMFLFNRVKQAGVFSAEAIVAAMAKKIDKDRPTNKSVFESGNNDGENLAPQSKKRRIG